MSKKSKEKDTKKVQYTANIEKKEDESKPKKKYKGYKALFTILGNYKKERLRLVAITFLVILTALLTLLFPIFQERMYAHIYAGEYQQFILFFAYFWLVEFACATLDAIRHIISEKASENIFYNMTVGAFSRFFPILSRKLDHENSGKLLNRITRDPSSLSEVYQYLLTTFANIFRNVAVMFIIYTYNWKIALYITIGVSLTYILYYVKNRIRQNYRKVDFKIRDGITGISNETIRGAKDVKVLDMQNQLLDKYSAKIDEKNKNDIIRVKKVACIDIVSMVINVAVWVGFAALTVHELELGNVTVSAALVMYQYSNTIYGIIGNISGLVDYMNEKELISERVLELYDETIYPQEKYGTTHLDSVTGKMSIENLTFTYDGKENLFENFSVNFEENKLTAIVGKSGEGKTSLSNVLFHLYDWQEGSVKLDGVDIRELDRESLKNNISVIIQQPYIFNMTIKENLLLAKKDATDEELWNVLEKAQLKDYVESLEKKLDSVVGENGIQMSGGQKQRLSIARALLKNTKVIIFDEATSSLDNESQSKIQKVMEDLKGDHTLIVIAHRLSTIKDADKIVVLDNHQVSAEGTHEELMKVSNVYKGLYATEKAE